MNWMPVVWSVSFILTGILGIFLCMLFHELGHWIAAYPLMENSNNLELYIDHIDYIKDENDKGLYRCATSLWVSLAGMLFSTHICVIYCIYLWVYIITGSAIDGEVLSPQMKITLYVCAVGLGVVMGISMGALDIENVKDKVKLRKKPEYVDKCIKMNKMYLKILIKIKENSEG